MSVGWRTTTIKRRSGVANVVGGGSGGGEVYVAEVMVTFVRYFVAFLFLEGLYLRPDTGATNMRDEIGRRVFRFRPRYALRFALMRALPALFETNIPAPLLYPQ